MKIECDKKDCYWYGMAVCAQCVHNFNHVRGSRSRDAYSTINDRMDTRGWTARLMEKYGILKKRPKPKVI
ncbi:MAG: hypothetical protein ACTSRA_00940 [Promethearchaeota archaeon]|nr:MAG: hypothetical protein [Helarchaeota virus Nidhogg Meg22_1012]URC17344.1 MAG: hypothetical protein [Helarchaeota virus Nidhogg Meg22_1214]